VTILQQPRIVMSSTS